MRRRRPVLAAEAERRWRERRARLGGELSAIRRRRKWSQDDLGRRAGVGRSVVSRAERGIGALDLDALERLAAALAVPLAISIERDLRQDDVETGHLAMQELVLRFGRRAGFTAQFEMSTRPAEPWRSCDVGLGSASRRVAVDVECWNSFGDIGAATRSSNRKVAELDQIAVARWGAAGRAALVWVVRDTDRNHAVVARYPEVFASRFAGSSRAWVVALTEGGPVPDEPGLIWCDLSTGRLHPWRRRVPTGSGS
jgi:transcriptional regulator with XRE-family HTH domain